MASNQPRHIDQALMFVVRLRGGLSHNAEDTQWIICYSKEHVTEVIQEYNKTHSWNVFRDITQDVRANWLLYERNPVDKEENHDHA